MNLDKQKKELEYKGFCVLKGILSLSLIDQLREAILPTLDSYLNENSTTPNRGPYRHFMAMPFEESTFRPEFFFNSTIVEMVKSALGEDVVADQWSCDTPVLGSEYQSPHADFQRPLFPEFPDLLLPAYMIVVNFGLLDIMQENGAIEIASGTHRVGKDTAGGLVGSGRVPLLPVELKKGDVLIRHPWTIHRGTPNTTIIPRPLITIRYVRPWYEDRSRDVNSIPSFIWQKLTNDQKKLLRFPIAE